jgi:DmsE family decaheme c-type cytochrome
MGMSTLSVEVAVVSARAWTLRKKQILSTAQAVIAAGAFFGLALTANAAPQDDPVSNLRSFVQTMPAQNADVAALANFLDSKPAPQTAGVKVASGDSLFGSLWSGQSTQQNGVPVQAAVPAKRARAAQAAAEATLVDNKVCLTCHAAQAAEFNKTLMGRIGLQKKGMFDCQNCHGPGSEHVKAGGGRGVGGIMGFGPTDPRTAEEKNAVCLGCHEKGNRTAWKGSTHDERGLACTNCHTVMKNVSVKHNLKTTAEMETCFQCHKLQRAQIQYSSHMPLREGKITCSDCHNPHGSVYGTEAMLNAPSINENCYKCHAEKRGPMLWEHAPVRENCLNCHQPHGSNHEYLLKVQRPRLCAECHAFAHGGQGSMGAAASTAYTVGHSCNNCHTQIHGSNHPSGAFFQR